MNGRIVVLAGITLAAVLGLTAACGGDSRTVVSNYLDDLEPGTTLHTLDVRYLRHGPAADIYARRPDYRPETLYSETWWEFDDAGALASMRWELKDEEGTPYASSRFDGVDLVYVDSSGIEESRSPGVLADLTVATYRATIRDALEQVLDALEAQPDAPVVTLRSVELRVLEERRPFTRATREASPTSYSVPYVHDLDPVERITRQYVSPVESRGFRYETTVVDAAGTETVISYTDHLVVEILRP
jgi:hypothetical protein